jgi:hypothetical protein
MNTITKWTAAQIFRGGLLGLLVMSAAGCGSLIDMGGKGQVDPRRIYLNDAAANDSLPGTLATEGLLLVMQPGGKQYKILSTGGAVNDPLDFYVRNSGGGFSFQQSVVGTMEGGTVKYSLTGASSKTVADYYLVFLRGTTGMPVTLPTSVRFVPVDTTQATTVKVRLHMIRQLSGLVTEENKALYAREFHTELASIFQAYGVTVDTSTVIVEPTAAPLTVVFNGAPVQYPGTRLAGAINMYLVNSIEGGSEGSTVVGFAPREAFDLSTNEESRVVLNVQGSTGSITQKARAMAVTGAHEMGHFLGLRHTSATLMDRGFDDDESNRDDGFASTPFCSALEKKSASDVREISIKGPGGHTYCLRVAGTAFTCACSDVNNLMYPYKCGVTQKTLGNDQRQVMRNNLKVYQ